MTAAVLRRTTVRCPTCDEPHDAVVERRDGRVVGRYTCGETPHEVPVSSSADLYETITRNARPAAAGASPWPPRPLLNLVEITDDCNFACPVCYASARPREAPRHLPVAEVLRAVTAVRDVGARNVTLTGGEPTVHPRIEELVERAAGLGLRVNLPTNGYRLGTEPDLARRLKRAGLTKVTIQLDTFDPETHQALRGNVFIDEKRRAFARCRDAGLRLGVSATVTHLNLDHVPALAEFGLGLAPAMQTIVFQVAARAGRFTASAGAPVDREAIVARLLASGVVPGLRAEHFWPLPSFRPWGMRVHADCGANAYVLTGGGGRRLLDDLLPVGELFGRLAASTLEGSFATRNLVPLALALQVTAPWRYPDLLRHLGGFLTGRGERSMVVLAAGGFLDREFYDLDRLACCSTTISSPAGPVSPCRRFR
jgi:molybdenum cofactor biosynthesis enzyme MoaA